MINCRIERNCFEVLPRSPVIKINAVSFLLLCSFVIGNAPLKSNAVSLTEVDKQVACLAAVC